MSAKILFVDDEPNLLAGIRRNLHKTHQIATASSGVEALKRIDDGEQFAVAVVDQLMPEMNGVELLRKIQQQSPDTVRVMLTGNADLDTALAAVNEGRVFQFVQKPCSIENLRQVIDNAVYQHRLLRAEKDLLENTLGGAVKALTDVLEIFSPDAFGEGKKLRDYIRLFGEYFDYKNLWELQIAAMLSQVGNISVPQRVHSKLEQDLALTGPELDILTRVPQIGYDLVQNIPRMHRVAEIILYQNKNFDGSGFPLDQVSGEAIPIGSRILRVLHELLKFERKKVPRNQALVKMLRDPDKYDPRVVEAAFCCFDIYLPNAHIEVERQARESTVRDLQIGQTILSDVYSEDGFLITRGNVVVTSPLLERLRNFEKLTGIRKPLWVEESKESSSTSFWVAKTLR